ncbi:MAG: MBL fold metallo-hydrolase [Propionivibrio sp.]|uniref:MBL fold metallo-hydrolase n=1 Tax=Propionivibrio sp. TaxID=2212460 RepID=UPI001A628183|nr:MBL fold metallo-hydrolase [Propionivibrio sp.]MBL8414895.1 MBL fold metallo-hydrolase [Propionivibrio sp.]
MRFASLGSGSKGNSLIVDAGDTRLLLDCGFSTRATIEKLARLGISPEEIDGVLVTHEHSDHIAGVFKFACRFGIPVHLTHGTYIAAPRGKTSLPECRLIDSHARFAIGSLEIHPFPVPHDAREPVQYAFSNGRHRLGVLTDSGSITQHIVDVLRVCDALVLECNHDQNMLKASGYPIQLKRRIAGNFGHLDNRQAASLLRQIETQQLQHIVAAHLSEQNNRPQLVVKALASALNCAEDWIGVADQENGFGWRQMF